MKLEKYNKNLKIEGNNVISYGTTVAIINNEFKELEQLGSYSVTTQKHINYVADELNLILIR